MGTVHRFIECPEATSETLSWFRSRSAPPTEASTDRGYTLYFPECGPLIQGADGRIDPAASPVVNVLVPRIRRGALWTVGEVHFLANPLRERFPALNRISREFSRWLAAHECVYSRRKQRDPFSYYLEGSIRNFDSEIFALASGLRALKEGQYFVADDDTEFRLDAICKALRLRGVECDDA